MHWLPDTLGVVTSECDRHGKAGLKDMQFIEADKS